MKKKNIMNRIICDVEMCVVNYPIINQTLIVRHGTF